MLRAAGAALALLAAGCLPGPWDYTPQGTPAFRGITVTGYAVSGKPVEQLCFERLLALTEASSEAFAFYDSADVGITGTFSNGGQTLVLTPDANIPNCFRGPANARFVRGQDYALDARFVWDSAGTRTVSNLSAVASIPDSFAIADTAYMPSLALRGATFDNITDPAVFMQLPPGPRGLFVAKYGDTLAALNGDSAGLAAWMAANGARMHADLRTWLQGDMSPYTRGDTVFYLNAQSGFGNLSHFFKANRGPDVKGILITQQYDTTGAKPVTPFDSLLGIAPDSSNFYLPGNRIRLIYYNGFSTAPDRHVFDSLGIVNVWFWSGLNRFYFYGMEDAYARYLTGLEESGGNPKIRIPTNVTGGRGFFAGLALDSFDVNVRLDNATQSFPYAATRAYTCRDRGWFDSRDCIGYLPEYCAGNGWSTPDCRIDAMYRLLDPVDSLSLPPAVRDSARAWGTADALLRNEAAQRYCIDHDYPAGVPECAPVRSECEDGPDGNACQRILWKRCELAYWKLPACTEGLRSFCRLNRDVHRTTCRDVAD